MGSVNFFKTLDNTQIKINSKIWSNVKTGDELSIDFEDKISFIMIELYKNIDGEQNISKILDSFNTTNLDSFYFDSDIVEFTDKAKIKDIYDIKFTINSQSVYESNIIDTFIDINEVVVKG